MAREDKDPLLDPERHLNKRRMAWGSFVFLIIMTTYIFLVMTPQHVALYDSLIGVAYFTFGGIILSYMGTTTVDSVSYWKNKRKYSSNERYQSNNNNNNNDYYVEPENNRYPPSPRTYQND